MHVSWRCWQLTKCKSTIGQKHIPPPPHFTIALIPKKIIWGIIDNKYFPSDINLKGVLSTARMLCSVQVHRVGSEQQHGLATTPKGMKLSDRWRGCLPILSYAAMDSIELWYCHKDTTTFSAGQPSCFPLSVAVIWTRVEPLLWMSYRTRCSFGSAGLCS